MLPQISRHKKRYLWTSSVHMDALLEAYMFTTWSCERQSTRGSCICTLRHFGQVCVFSKAVKGHCVTGHHQMLFWSRMRQNKQERSGGKTSFDRVQTLSPITVCLPQLGPNTDPHINTPWPPHWGTHTHTHFSKACSLRASWMKGKKKQKKKTEEAGEQGAGGVRYLFDPHGDADVMVLWLWPLPLWKKIKG